MDRNAVLAFVLSFVVLSLWMTWEAENRPEPVEAEAILEEAAPPERIREERASPTPVLAPQRETSPAPAPPREELAAERLKFENGSVRVELSSRGAGVTHWELLNYRVTAAADSDPVALIVTPEGEPPAFATAFTELGIGDLSDAVFDVVERGPQDFVFELERAGVRVRKSLRFEEDGYRLRMRIEVENQTPDTLEPSFLVVLIDRGREGADFRELALVALADGSVERAPISGFGLQGFLGSMTGGAPERERAFPGAVEWAGTDSHYFLTAMVPDVARDALASWSAIEPGQKAQVTLSQPVSLLAGTAVAREVQIYAGPKDPPLLQAVGAQLDRAIQYGWAWIAPVTRGFSWMLSVAYSLIPNYGIAIILLTILVRLVTAPLTYKQMESMKRLGTMQPRMKELQEKYKDNRERQSQEMAKLMKETGWNPLGGCLPMILQVPVFIGLYYALQSSISLRHAPFMLWINDLSSPETLFMVPGLELPIRVLPILMCLSMVAQQKLTPTTTMDPMQQRMMLVMMPLMFGFLFYTFPSGLVLYWLVSNLLAIAQMLYMNRNRAPAEATA
ncbi:membrane protein insertase YidC [Myxococcota bacterium]|nr:membrane protein insertase YidC [Myxococcota bacterium]MCZ7617358.1 membrane protein insertase YidC [Myxococcota bacterium]